MPVVLLSKFGQHAHDNENMLATLLANNDGVWFNRFSRMHMPFNADPAVWYAVEQTPFADAALAAIKKISQYE